MEYFKKFLFGSIFGLGFIVVVIPVSEMVNKYDSNKQKEAVAIYDREFIGKFELSNVSFVKHGPYLGISGEIKGNFENVKGFRVNALIFEGETLIEECYTDDHWSEEKHKWFFQGKCSNISYMSYDKNFTHELKIGSILVSRNFIDK